MITRRSILAFLGLAPLMPVKVASTLGESDYLRVVWTDTDLWTMRYTSQPLLLEAVIRFQSTARGELLS